jgi:hydroxyacylglutathione hydrolase
MRINYIEAFSDNYIWIIEENDGVVVVDPGEAWGVLNYLKNQEKELSAILLTHKHDDHVGGVKEILSEYPDAPIFGPIETKQLVEHVVQDGDSFEILGRHFKVLKTAGHSEEHISYVTEGALFCGDALFSGGCGRVFTGDYQAQFEALQKFKELDDTTKVFAGHEYTQTNLRFAQSIKPTDNVIADALDEVNRLRSEEVSTLPTTIGKEKEINLFMQAETVEEFTELRNARDEF